MTLRLMMFAVATFGCLPLQAQDWTIDTAQEWKQNIESAEGAAVADGMVSPTGKKATIVTKVFSSDAKRSAAALTINQSPIWQNWNPIKDLGPSNLGDAPVMLTLGAKNYWMFGRYRSGGGKNKGKGQKKGKGKKEQAVKEVVQDKEPFVAEDATLEGFDIRL